MVVVAKVPRLPRSDSIAAASTAHQSSVDERSEALAHLLVRMAVSPKSGTEWLDLGSCCREGGDARKSENADGVFH
jgi:hypothetical protein